MSGNGNQVPLAPSQRGPGPYPRASTPHRPECYHASGAASGGYLSNATGAQAAALTLRGQPAPQPSAPPAPQQDMSKTSMAGPNYATPQNQTQARPQYPNFQFRASQHGSRPNTHPRQQQPFMAGGGATPGGPVVYHPSALVFQPQHMTIPQTYQQPRSSTPGFYSYMPQYIGYTTPASPGPYYYGNGQQLPGGSVGGNPAGRSNPGALVPQPVSAPNAPSTSIPHPQPQPHLHPAISGIRQVPPKRVSHRVPIIDPVTQQDIFSENSNDSQYIMGESSERQTPQPEKTCSVAEEFSRMVNEVANQPISIETANKNSSKNEVPATAASLITQPHTNAINSNINIKSEIININESKNLGADVAEANETPVVSAISDSPVVVPKMTMNIKQLPKSSEPSQPLAIDKNLQNKQSKKCNKPFVPHDDVEKNDASIVPPQPQTPVDMNSVLEAVPTANVTQPAPSSGQGALATPAPQPQRAPRERVRSEDKKKESPEKETPKPNGPTSIEISSVDSLPETINPPTSQHNQANETKAVKQLLPATETEIHNLDKNPEVVNIKESIFQSKQTPTATELLSASIEKVAAKEGLTETDNATKEEYSASQAQAKLAESIASVTRTNPELKMKDINLNNKATDSDTANGNTVVETVKDDSNKNEKTVKNNKNNNKKAKMVNSETSESNVESYENGQDEADNIEPENVLKEEISESTETLTDAGPSVTTPKYKYSDDQWSPQNMSGKKYYDIDLLMQIKDDPMSKNKPNIALLETWNVMRATPVLEPIIFNPISRPMNDAFFPNFLKASGVGPRTNVPKEPKKDGRNIAQSGKGSVKLSPSVSGSGAHKPVIHVSLSLREEVKLNQTKDAWKPARFKKDALTENEAKTQELYKKFRGILNKLTPQKFDTLLDRVNALEIDTQSRLEGVIDLIFEKAIDEPNFSEAYATMCSKLSTLKVPATNVPESTVNFRVLIIARCQRQFVTKKVDEQVQKLEDEIGECTDPTKKKELLLQLEEENRRVRMRSVGNVRFIGELYKLKMLTPRIMVFCMNDLIEKLEEEKLECLCKLLTTIGEQVESEVKEQLESVFKKMQEIVDRKFYKISSRVRFMIQDVIELRRRKWVVKNVVDSQPKMMDQIQKEAEQQQRHIELMNASPIGNFRRDEGGRGKRGDGRRQGSNSYMDNAWKSSRPVPYVVDTSKLKAGTGTSKNLNNIKLAPSTSAWNHGSSTKSTAQASSNSMISISKNMYSMLENVQTDPTSLKTLKDISPSYQHSKSIERSTFNSRGDFNSGSGSRSGSVGVTRSNSGSRNTASPVTPAADTPSTPVQQEILSDDKRNTLKTMVLDHLVNPNNDGMVVDLKQVFTPNYHANVIAEILNITIDKPAKEILTIINLLLHLVSTNTITPENFFAGMTEILDIAPDLYIDIPMLYEYLGKLIAPQVEKKHITFAQALRSSKKIISANHGHLLLKCIIKDLRESMGPSFVKTKWDESGLQLKEWMDEEQVPKWLEDNKFEFLEGGTCVEETKKIITPAEAQSKLLKLMNAEENCECIRGWVKDNLGASSNEDWFMRALSQSICEYTLYGSDNRDMPHFSQERMNKYSSLINDFGEAQEKREASCLFGIQQLIHRLEHPQGLTLEIFQFLHEHYIISVNGFIAWELSEKEPEGKAVMLKALTSFFTNIKEADNEDSCSED